MLVHPGKDGGEDKEVEKKDDDQCSFADRLIIKACEVAPDCGKAIFQLCKHSCESSIVLDEFFSYLLEEIKQVENQVSVAAVPPLFVIESHHDPVVGLEVIGDVVGRLHGPLSQFFVPGCSRELKKH